MRAPSLISRPVDLRPGVLPALAAAYPERYPVLLDSAARGALAEASMLAAFPRASAWQSAEGALCRDDPTGMLPPAAPTQAFLTYLEACLASGPAPWLGAEGLPFRGGWMVYLAYEMAAEVEPRLRQPTGQSLRAFVLRTPLALVQLADGQGWLVAEPDVPGAQIEQLLRDLATVPLIETPAAIAVTAVHEEAPERFQERVRRAQDYIRAGDIYQANLSRPWQVDLAEGTTVGALYGRLRQANPAPFAALVQFRDLTLLSSSPERLLRIRDGRIDTRPIAGTHPRGATPEEDQRLAAALLAHPKERAEHIMLIDLERNDLGRVCQAGSVHVDEYMGVETYAHVHHIVSNVTGLLRPGLGPVDALRAAFPGGTITGCPKLRCMEIIAELENEARGAYTGSLGYINLDGSTDFNILIRTMTLVGHRITFRAGAGIVADSDPQCELHETRSKARGMMLALGIAASTP
jgi:anthranilate synthase component 1